MTMSDFPVAILSGGLATRMRPLTERRPKALLPVAGRPFLVHQLDLLQRCGVQRVVLCVGYLGEMIRAAIPDGKPWGMALEYSFDGPGPLGTGGAVRRALPGLGKQFFVLYGDSYLPTNYAAVAQAFVQAAQPALMTTFHNEGRWDTSNVVFRNGRIINYDKRRHTPDMQYIDYGLSVLTPATFAGFESQTPLDLAEVFKKLIADGRLAGYEVHERFYEAGSQDGLETLETLLGRYP